VGPDDGVPQSAVDQKTVRAAKEETLLDLALRQDTHFLSHGDIFDMIHYGPT
jgi:hypothetical protein